MKTTPNWCHNSGKPKRTRGRCKAVAKARKQSLKHLLKALTQRAA